MKYCPTKTKLHRWEDTCPNCGTSNMHLYWVSCTVSGYDNTIKNILHFIPAVVMRVQQRSSEIMKVVLLTLNIITLDSFMYIRNLLRNKMNTGFSLKMHLEIKLQLAKAGSQEFNLCNRDTN